MKHVTVNLSTVATEGGILSPEHYLGHESTLQEEKEKRLKELDMKRAALNKLEVDIDNERRRIYLLRKAITGQ